jgi:hypothetical protein
MPRSKDKYPERNGEKWSYCYQSSPSSCSTHFHINAKQLSELVSKKKAFDASKLEELPQSSQELLESVFKEESEEEYAARVFSNINIFKADGTTVVDGDKIDAVIEMVNIITDRNRGRLDKATGKFIPNNKDVYRATILPKIDMESEIKVPIVEDFDTYREAAEFANKKVESLDRIHDIYGKLIDLRCKVEGCDYASGGPSHYNYKDSGSLCQHYPSITPHCTCRACWG